jgi:PAS domain S-box-containing protein
MPRSKTKGTGKPKIDPVQNRPETALVSNPKELHSGNQQLVIGSFILDANDLLVMVRDRQGRITHFNHACQELTGYSLDEVKGKRTWDFLVPANEIPEARAAFDEAQIGAPTQGEYRWVAKDGRTVLTSWSNTVATTDDGVEYVIGTGIHVTQRQEPRQQMLREQEGIVRALLESAVQAILAINREGKIVLANAAAEAMFGYSREELMVLTVEELIPERLRDQHVHHRINWFSQPENRRMGLGRDLVARCKNGTEFPVEISLSHIQTKDGMLGVSFISDITERKKAESTLLNYQRQMESLAGRLLSVQENESKIIARELHDDLSQRLAALGMEVSALSKRAADSPYSFSEGVRELSRRIGSLAEDVHRMSRQLHSAVLEDLGLEAAVREECISLSNKLGIPVEFQTENLPPSIAADISLCLFRVAQESLRNIGKHAGAKEVRVRLARVGTDLHLSVDDVGNGFDLEEVRGKGGLGLISMEERVRLVHGDFKIHSQPGEGTRVEARVPLEKTAS